MPSIKAPEQKKTVSQTKTNKEQLGKEYDPGCDADEILKGEILSYLERDCASLTCSFYGGTRFGVGLKIKDGGIAILSALPEMFDNKYEYASDCYSLIREISAISMEGESWTVEKNDNAHEYAPGFMYIPDDNGESDGFVIAPPAVDGIIGDVYWIKKEKDGSLNIETIFEYVNFNGQSTYEVVQPKGNVVAGFCLYDKAERILCAVARKVNGTWELVKVTASSAQLAADAQKAIAQQASDPRTASAKVETSRNESAKVEQPQGKNSKSDSSKSGKSKTDKHKRGKDKDSREDEARGGNDRGLDVDAPSERGSDVSVPNERELETTSPRDSGRGGEDDVEGRR